MSLNVLKLVNFILLNQLLNYCLTVYLFGKTYFSETKGKKENFIFTKRSFSYHCNLFKIKAQIISWAIIYILFAIFKYLKTERDQSCHRPSLTNRKALKFSLSVSYKNVLLTFHYQNHRKQDILLINFTFVSI